MTIPKFPIHLIIDLGFGKRELLRTWLYLRKVAANRCGIIPQDHLALARKLGITPKTLETRIRILTNMGFLERLDKNVYKLVPLNRLPYRTHLKINFSMREILDKELFTAKCFALCTALEARVQSRIRQTRQSAVQRNKEANIRRHGERHVIEPALMSYGFATKAFRISRNLISKAAKRAEKEKMLVITRQIQVFTPKQYIELGLMYDPRPIYYSRVEQVWKINAITEYRLCKEFIDPILRSI